MNVDNSINTNIVSLKQSDRTKLYSVGRTSYDTKHVKECTLDKTEIHYKEQIFASSGKDILEVRPTNKENVYAVLFDNSVMVNRAISRGYIVVNGKTVQLSNDEKERLLRTEKAATSMRLKSFLDVGYAHDIEVTKQEMDTLNDFQKKLGRALETANKYAKGERVSPSELKELMETCPDLYKMAMVMRMMEKDRDDRPKPETKDDTDNEEEIESVSWDDFEWKGYETEMEVDLSGDEPVIGEISVSEKVLNV